MMRKTLSNGLLKLPLALMAVLCFSFMFPDSASARFNNWSSNGPSPARSVIKAIKATNTKVYAGSNGGGVFATTLPAGTVSNWIPDNAGMTDRQVQTVEVNPANMSIVYAGTRNGIFKSINSGINWAPSSAGLVTPLQSDIRDITVSPGDANIMYAATADGVFKSVTGGDSWSAANSSPLLSDVRCIVIDPAVPANSYPETVYAGASGGIFKSVDAGTTWSSTVSQPGNTDIRDLLLDPANPAIIYAATANGVYKTTDSGATWSGTSLNIPTLTLFSVSSALILAGTDGSGLYSTPDEGANWTQVAAIASPVKVYGITSIPGTPTNIYTATDHGIYRSTNNGSAWTAYSGGLIQGKSVLVSTIDKTKLVSGFSGGGLYRSDDSGASWIQTGTTAATELFATSFAAHSSGSPVYAGSGSGVFVSSDNGQTWSPINNGLSNLDVRAVAIDGSDNLYAGTSAGVFSYNSGTSTWSEYNSATLGNKDVKALAFKGSDLYAGTNGGGIYKISTPSGVWGQKNNGLASNTVINALATEAGTVFAGTSGGAYRSVNDGDSWNIVLPDHQVNALATHITPPFVVAGTNGTGVYFSTDNGDTWTVKNADLHNLNINGIATASDTTPAMVYAATGGTGIYSLSAAPEPDIKISDPPVTPPDPVAYNKVNINEPQPRIYTISNIGLLKLNVTGINLTGADSASFSISSDMPTNPYGITSPSRSKPCDLTGIPAVNISIDPDDYCTLWVTFTPTSSGIKSALLKIIYAAPTQENLINLQGEGGYPPVAQFSSPATGSTIRTTATSGYPITGTAIDKNSDGTDGTGANLTGVQIWKSDTETWVNATRNITLNSWTTWSYNLTSPASGPYILKARATDSAGFTQTALSEISLTVDNIAPDTTINSNPPLNSTDNTPEFTFASTKPVGLYPLATFQCSIDTAAFTDCFSPYILSTQSEGSHTFRVKAYDGIDPLPGNADPTPATYTWTVDTIPPTTNITPTNPSSSYTQLTTATFTFTSQTNSTFKCKIDENPFLDCTSPLTFTGLSDRSHTFYAQATDPAGNIEINPASYSWRVDTAKPVSSIDSIPATLSGISHTFTGAASDPSSDPTTAPFPVVSTVEVSFDGSTWLQAADTAVSPSPPWSTWSYFWPLPINGDYTIQSRATDSAGNVQQPASVNFIVANPLPTATITYPDSATRYIGNAGSKIITGTALAATGGLPVDNVQVSITNSTTSENWQNADKATTWDSWSYNWTPVPVDGIYYIKARSIDSSGNISAADSAASRTITLDQTAPTSTIDPPSNSFFKAHSISVSGTADDTLSGVSRVDIIITDSNDQTVSTETAQFNSISRQWSYTSNQLPDGLYTVRSISTDIAGNQQTSVTTQIITLDNVPPVSTILPPLPPDPSNSNSPAFSFSSNELSSFTCTLRKTVNNITTTISTGLCSCTPTGTYSNSCSQVYPPAQITESGDYSFTVQATDRAGNAETTPPSYLWHIDLINPQVTVVEPPDGTSLVSISYPLITATFSEPVDPATVTTATFTLTFGTTHVTGSVSMDQGNTVARFTPAAKLNYAGVYTATVTTGIKDTAGNPLPSPRSWNFTTHPDGDINLDGVVTIEDAILALQVAVGRTVLPADKFMHGDVAPLKDGLPLPDGIIEGRDAMVILGKCIGKHNW